MDSDAPDEVPKAAAVHDGAGRSNGLVDWRRQAGREIFYIMHRNFDPLGLLAPVTIRLKILLQESSKAGVEWDQRHQRTLPGRVLLLTTPEEPI